MKRTALALSVGVAVALVGCGDHARSVSIAHGALTLYDHEVRIQHSGAPDARITAGGVLRIGSDEVALTGEQKATASAYYDAAMALPGLGLDTGKAGVAVGAAAIKEVASGLAKGDTSQIDKNIEAKADAVKQSALKICADLVTIRAAQDSLAASLAAFRPYAVLTSEEVDSCAKDMKN